MPSSPGQSLAGVRIAIGIGALVAPRLIAKLFGFDPEKNPQSSYFARLFGIRDIVLGVGTLRTTGPSRRLWWQLGIATDATDVASAVLGHKDGSMSTVTTALAAGTAAMATGLGVAALAAED